MNPAVYLLSSGKQVQMPVRHRLRRGFAVAFVGPSAALAGVVPAGPWKLARVGRAGSLVVITYHDFADSPVGPYQQVSVAAPVMWGDSPGVPLLPLLAQGLYRTDRLFRRLGFVVLQIPVSGAEAVAYSREIWGEPAWQAEFLVERGPGLFSCTVLEDGREFLAAAVGEAGIGGRERKNYRLYSLRGGKAMRDTMRVEAASRVLLWPRAASLRAGEHPRAGFLGPFARRGLTLQRIVYGEGTVRFDGPVAEADGEERMIRA